MGMKKKRALLRWKPRRFISPNVFRMTWLRSIVEKSLSLRKLKPITQFINILTTQLMVYSKTKVEAAKTVQELLQAIKQRGHSPISYLEAFFTKAMLRIFLRDYQMGAKRLTIPVPASYEKKRLNFLKQFLSDIKQRSESNLILKFLGEIDDFYSNRGVTYTKKIDAYIISKQNRAQSKFAYKANAYMKKNAVKKNKFFFI